MKTIGILFKQIGIFLCLLWGFTLPLFAQVAIPTLDITRPIVSSAAAAWSKASFVTYMYHESNGDRKLDDKEIYKYDSNGMGSTILISGESFHIGGSYKDNSTEVKLDRYYDGEILLEENESRLYVALLLDGFAALGIGAYNQEEKRYLDQNSKSVKTRYNAISGSASIKFWENFYLGLQADRVKEKQENTVDNSWTDITYGLGALFGDPGGTQMRLEYSLTNSPRSEESSWNDEQSSIHYKTTISRGSIELKFKGLLFSGMSRQSVVKKDFTSADTNESANELRRNETEGSVMWVPQEGLMLGFSFIKDTTEHVYKDEHNAFKLKVGYLF